MTSFVGINSLCEGNHIQYTGVKKEQMKMENLHIFLLLSISVELATMTFTLLLCCNLLHNLLRQNPKIYLKVNWACWSYMG